MMKRYLVLILLSVFAVGMFASGSVTTAPKEKKSSKKAAVEEEYGGKVPGKIYVFACSFEFGDSILYISSIQEVDSMALQKKTKFLPYRSDFSQQFKDNLESGSRALKNQTASVFFATNKNSLKKTYDKLKKRTIKKSRCIIYDIDESEFKFVHPLDYFGVAPAEK